MRKPGGISLVRVLGARTGHLIGAECYGREGVAERIGMLTLAIQDRLTMDDLATMQFSGRPPQTDGPARMITVSAAQQALRKAGCSRGLTSSSATAMLLSNECSNETCSGGDNMAGDGYWNVQKWQSRVKARIVQKYFDGWSGVMAANAEKLSWWPADFAYFDLFAGRGEYRDGSASTPLLVLEKALEKPAVTRRVSFWFNDADSDFVEDLRAAIQTLDGLEALHGKWRVTNRQVNEGLAAELPQQDRPTLFFLDPWGYKGLSLDLIWKAIRNVGSECILFFNFNAINRDIRLMGVRSHMEALFGRERLQALIPALSGLSPAEREDEIMRQIGNALSEAGAEYKVDFQFLNKTGTRTRHYLIHVCKDLKGHDIMKDVMASESSVSADGVASYVHDPAHHYHGRFQFDELSGHDLLGDILLKTYAGGTLTRAEIQADHSPETRYRPPDYRLALLMLEEKEKIRCKPQMGDAGRRAGSFPAWVEVTFPDVKE